MKRNRIHEKAEAGQSVIMTPFGIAFSFEISSKYDGAVWFGKRRNIAFKPADDGGNHRCSSGQERRRTVWLGNLVC